jgi:phosphorylated CTD-interacting factor 1
MSKLEVSRLPASCTSRDISELFDLFGNVKSIASGSRSTFIVEMEDARDAQHALSKLDNKPWRGTHIQVQSYEDFRRYSTEQQQKQAQQHRGPPLPSSKGAIFDRLGDRPEPKPYGNSGNFNGNSNNSSNSYNNKYNNNNYKNSNNSGNNNNYDKNNNNSHDRRDNNSNYDSNRYNEDRAGQKDPLKEKMFNFDNSLLVNYNVKPNVKHEFLKTFPSPSCELERYKVISKLFKYYTNEIRDRFHIQAPEDAFVRWLIEQYSIPKADQDDFNDPILPAPKRIGRSDVIQREILKSLPQSLHLTWFQKTKPLQKTLDQLNKYVSSAIHCAKEFNCKQFFYEHSERVHELREQGLPALEESQKKCLEKLNQIAKEMPKSFSSLTLEVIDNIILQLNTNCVLFFRTIFKPKVTRFFEDFIEESEGSISFIKNFNCEIETERVYVNQRNGTVTISFKGDSHTINELYYQKFEKLYSIHSQEIDPKKQYFHNVLYCLIRRHETCFAKEVKGAGFQASAPSHVWETIISQFGVTHESFASPLNCYLPNICSAFPDIDIYFGSKGSFFDFTPREGSFQLGTPNVEEVMIKAANKVNLLLDNATGPMSWICFLPDWSDPPSLFLSIYGDSKYLTKKYLVPGRSYSYNRGDQHLPLDRGQGEPFAFVAPFSSWIYILQNEAGQQAWPVNETNMNLLIEAFNSSK